MFSISSVNYSSFLSNIIHTPVCPKIAAKCIPYYDLNADLKSIKQKVSANSAYTLSNSELTQVKEAFIKCNNLFAGELLKNLTQIPLDEVKKAVFIALEYDNETKIRVSLDCFLKSLGNKDLIQFSGINSERLDSSLEKDKLLRNKALNSVLYTKGKAIWKELYYEASYFFHHLIETFISMTGFNEIGGRVRHRYEESSMNSYEAKAKIELYMALLAYPSILFVTFLSITGSIVLAGMASGIIVTASILLIPIYVRYLRPCPNQYSGLINLNQKILRNKNSPVFQRADILDRIQNAFCAGKGVILTGGPGTGKTSIAESLAELVALKKAKKSAHFLNGAQMFSANANQFKDFTGNTLSFQSLSEHFNDHSKSLVLFVDEIASLYEKGPLTGNSVKSFLTFLDQFPNVVCATTTEEYDKFIEKDEPFNRRLVHIEIKPLEPKELESALYQYLQYSAPELILGDNVISYIIDKSAEFHLKTSQIDGAMSLLKGAIIKASHITFEGLEKEINALKLEIEYLENHLLHCDHADSIIEIKEYQKKQNDLKARQEQLSKKMDVVSRIKKIEALCLKVKCQGYQLAFESATKSAVDSKKWLINHAAHHILTDFLTYKRNELELPTGLNKKLIDDATVHKVEVKRLAALAILPQFYGQLD